MANLGEKITTTLFRQADKVADEVMSHHPLLNLLKEKGKVKYFSGGYEIRKAVMYNTTYNGGSYSGYETFNIPQADDVDVFQYDIKQLYEPFILSGRDIRSNNGSKERLVDWAGQKFAATKMRLKNNLSAQILGDGTGNGGKDFDGIGKHIDTAPTTGTLGKVDRSSNTWAQNATSNVTLTSANVQSEVSKAITDIARNSEGPDCALAGKTAWGLMHDSLTAIQRLTDNTSKPNAGFRNFVFDGVTFFNAEGYGASAVLGTNTVRLINTNYMSLELEKEANFKPLAKGERPYDQDAYTTIIIVEGNLCSSAPALQSVIYP